MGGTQGVPSSSHLFRTASSKVSTTFYQNKKSKTFQALANSTLQPVDPTYTYAQLVSNGVRRTFQRLETNFSNQFSKIPSGSQRTARPVLEATLGVSLLRFTSPLDHF